MDETSDREELARRIRQALGMEGEPAVNTPPPAAPAAGTGPPPPEPPAAATAASGAEGGAPGASTGRGWRPSMAGSVGPVEAAAPRRGRLRGMLLAVAVVAVAVAAVAYLLVSR